MVGGKNMPLELDPSLPLERPPSVVKGSWLRHARNNLVISTVRSSTSAGLYQEEGPGSSKAILGTKQFATPPQRVTAYSLLRLLTLGEGGLQFFKIQILFRKWKKVNRFTLKTNRDFKRNNKKKHAWDNIRKNPVQTSFPFEKAVNLIHHLAWVQWITGLSWVLENKATSTMGWILPQLSQLETRLWLNGSRMRPNWHSLRHFLAITTKKKAKDEQVTETSVCAWQPNSFEQQGRLFPPPRPEHCSIGRKEASKVASACSWQIHSNVVHALPRKKPNCSQS